LIIRIAACHPGIRLTESQLPHQVRPGDAGDAFIVSLFIANLHVTLIGVLQHTPDST
jgi:hypothetical protein